MKRQSALFFALSLVLVSAAAAEMFTTASISGPPRLFAQPARAGSGLELGFFGNDVEDVPEYSRFGADASFGFLDFRAGAVFEYTYLDSIYRRIRGAWEFAYARPHFGAGVSYTAELEMFPGETSWGAGHAIFGAYAHYPSFLALSALVRVPTSGDPSSAAALHWLRDTYEFYVEYSYEKEHSVLFGQEIVFGSWAVECAYRYPGPRFYLGLSLWWGGTGAFAGVTSVSEHYLGYTWRIRYRRE